MEQLSPKARPASGPEREMEGSPDAGRAFHFSKACRYLRDVWISCARKDPGGTFRSLPLSIAVDVNAGQAGL